MSEENKALVRRYMEAMDRQDQPALRELVAPNFIMSMAGAPPMDFEGATQIIGMFYGAFPDITHHIDDIIAEGDKVAVRLTARATHKGDFQGVPPTGKQVTVEGYNFVRISAGKIAEQWGMADMMSLMQQIGAIPAPVQA